MRSWLETASDHFTARHDETDAEAAAEVLELLESTRERLGRAFPELPEEVAVVIHATDAQLMIAQPLLPLRRLITAPAARRYLAGGVSRREVHVLSPARLEERASAVTGSREMLMLTPAALYARLVVAANNPLLTPPRTIGRTVRSLRWAWLAAGAPAWFAGQTAHARPAISRRLHEGAEPDFPPGLRDAALLGGTVIDLLAREEGEIAAVNLAMHLDAGGPKQALVRAFHGRPLVHTEGTWRAHLAKLASSG